MLPADEPARALAAAAGEALDNARRHAGAGARTWVLVEDDADTVTVSIRDDGHGFAEGRLAEAAAAGGRGRPARPAPAGSVRRGGHPAAAGADPSIRVVILPASGERQDVLDAMTAGATGYLVKSAQFSEMLAAVRAAAAGKAVFTPGLAGLVLGEHRRLGPSRTTSRTPSSSCSCTTRRSLCAAPSSGASDRCDYSAASR